MGYIVYILYSNTCDKFYIGYTNDEHRRLTEHNHDDKGYTTRCRPWLLKHKEMCKTRTDAMRLERYLKSLKSKERLKQYIGGWRSSGSPK